MVNRRFTCDMNNHTTNISNKCSRTIGVRIKQDTHAIPLLVHINIVRNKIAKNISVMNRVKHVLTSSALYSLYCTLVMPYLNYCCEVWANNYKTRIQSLFILQKRAIRICLNTNYKCHTKPFFLST